MIEPEPKLATALSNAQQDAVASMVLQELRRKERLARQAETYPGYGFSYFLLPVILCLLAGWLPEGRLLVEVALLLTFVLIQFHAWGINRRLNALMKLGAGEDGQEAKSPRAPVVGL